MSAPLGPVLAVYSDTTVCDGPHGHEGLLVTDGYTAIAHTMDEGTDLTVTREHTTLTAGCRAVHHGETCPGTYTWDLATPAWTGDRATLNTLAEHGSPVETTDAHDAAVQG